MKAATTAPGFSANCTRISIHAAREGGDVTAWRGLGETCAFQSTPPVKAATRLTAYNFSALIFQSTPPVKAATEWTADDTGVTKISIHAAREGGDRRFTATLNEQTDFNPRRP